jgi:hypothetical protein
VISQALIARQLSSRRLLKGFWTSDDQIYIDEIALVFIDLSLADYPPAVVEKTLESVRAHALKAYEEAGARQIDIWMTVEPLEIYQGST